MTLECQIQSLTREIEQLSEEEAVKLEALNLKEAERKVRIILRSSFRVQCF